VAPERLLRYSDARLQGYDGRVTWVDFAVLGVIAVSGILALSRGLVSEVLGLGAWVAAAAVAFYGYPMLEPHMAEWTGFSPDISQILSVAAIFLVTLMIFALVTGRIGAVVRDSALGGLDRTLGLVFGLARGAVLVVAVYIGAGMLTSAEQWPDPVKDARSLPFIADGASWLVSLLPPALRPPVTPPPMRATPTAAELMRAPAARRGG